ncbi:M28 family peptidase [Haloferula helveola]
MTDEEVEARPARKSKIVIMLVLLPFWLVASTVLGVWLWHRGQQQQEAHEPEKFRTEISADGLADDVNKLVNICGPRHVGTEQGERGLSRAAAMIEGTLGPSNAGYRIESSPGPPTPNGSWPIIRATLPGDEREPLVVLAAYDASPDGGGVEANATGVASVMGIAQALAGENLGRPVVFAFVPHAYDAGSPRQEALERLLGKLGSFERILVVEATGADAKLIASASDPGLLTGLEGRVITVEIDQAPLESALYQAGQPAVRISTRRPVTGDVADSGLPLPGVHAEATRKLAELVRGLAGNG